MSLLNKNRLYNKTIVINRLHNLFSCYMLVGGGRGGGLEQTTGKIQLLQSIHEFLSLKPNDHLFFMKVKAKIS